VIAYSVRRLPFVVRSAAAGFQQTSVTLEEAAQNLGCLPLRTLMKITVPLIMANLLAGALLAFSFAMLEVSGSLISRSEATGLPDYQGHLRTLSSCWVMCLIASAVGIWAMCFLGTTNGGSQPHPGQKAGSDLPRLRPFARARYRLQDQ